ncbi:MAG: universal stress protein [Bacteroidia bacterium]|nr:universal stress protein [Bacteroidia bacterium]
MKKILVPVDFLENSFQAALYAGHLAAQARGEVWLLNAYHIPVQMPDMPISMMEIKRQEAAANMKNLMDRLRKEGGWPEGSGPVLKPQVREGLAVDLVVELALEEKMDLIVMGTQGAKGLEELIFGTHTTSVLQQCKCPLLAMPGGATFQGMDRIVFATDWMAVNNLVFRQLVGFASLLNAEIDVVHVVEPEEKYQPERVKRQEEILAGELDYAKINFHLIEAESVLDGLEDYINRSGAHLLAMFTHKRNALQALFHPSLTRRMSMHTHIPLLAIHG